MVIGNFQHRGIVVIFAGPAAGMKGRGRGGGGGVIFIIITFEIISFIAPSLMIPDRPFFSSST